MCDDTFGVKMKTNMFYIILLLSDFQSRAYQFDDETVEQL